MPLWIMKTKNANINVPQSQALQENLAIFWGLFILILAPIICTTHKIHDISIHEFFSCYINTICFENNYLSCTSCITFIFSCVKSDKNIFPHKVMLKVKWLIRTSYAPILTPLSV